jgi:NodT family efflux transporter outer membrane factor (OMF) lipoprotein
MLQRPRLCCAIVLAALVAACTVGPDFSPPEAPKTSSSYTPPDETTAPIDAGPRAGRQTLMQDEPLAADWWTLFHSPQLSEAVNAAIAGNRTLEAARARLIAAHEAVNIAAGALYPQVDLDASVSRQKVSAASFGLKPSQFPIPANFNVYQVGPTASFPLDIFGGRKRLVELRTADAEAEAYNLYAAQLALTGNTASQAVLIASLRAQLQAVDDITRIDRENLDLVSKSRDAGVAPDADVVTAESQLAIDETLRPPIEQQLSQARHAMALLIGRTPGDYAPPDFDLAALTLPGELPLSLPSALVHQRPDILAAEAQLHSATAAVGVATAQLYPDVTLDASAGLVALTPGALFQKSGFVWSIAAGATAPIFHGGTLEAQRKAALANLRVVLADYEQTVLASFVQVADLLQALKHDADLLAAQQRALDSASNSVRLQRLAYTGGGAGIIAVLDAQRQYEQARLGYVRAEAQRYADTIQLFVAMGGGWWNSPSQLTRDASAKEQNP